MSFAGLDIGTTGCKAVVFSLNGTPISSAYEEYDIKRPHPGYAELDSVEVWEKVKKTIARAARDAGRADPVQALAVASMGEAVVPVSADRRILGPSILIVDSRGEDQAELLKERVEDAECYAISGNAVGNQYGLTKLMWLRDHEPSLYDETFQFLNWSGFVAYMLGGEPTVDYALANRMLLFDLANEDWSSRLIEVAGLDRAKLPRCVSAGSRIGEVDPTLAAELNLPRGTLIAAGTHDQCANALGSGTLKPGTAMYGMGTFPTIVPVFTERKDTSHMIDLGLNTEHHAAPARYVSFIYHMGGSIVKWYRDTFAAAEHQSARQTGEDVYPKLFAELPEEPGPLLIMPHFNPMGPPDYISDSSGVILGLKTDTKRGDILKAILEGNNFAHRITVDRLDTVGISIEFLRAVGGGSRSDTACQICADIFNRPVQRADVTEAGALGAAMLAGLATGSYSSLDEAAERIAATEAVFEPKSASVRAYEELYRRYLRLRELTLDFSREWSSFKYETRHVD